MNQSQRELRRAAAQAFMESLDQMGRRLSTEPAAQEPAAPTPAPIPAQPFPVEGRFQATVKEWEEAVADIEQFTREQGGE